MQHNNIVQKMADSIGESCARSAFSEMRNKIDGLISAEDCSIGLREIYSSLFTSKDHYFSNSVKSREIFLERYYGNTLEQILFLAKKSWFPKYKKNHSTDFDSFFKDGRAMDVFFSLTHLLNKEKHTIVIKECIRLLEQFATTDKFSELFWDQAKVLPKTSHDRTFYDPPVQMIWNEIIKRVISLPDRVSNIYKLPDGSILWPEGFYRMIGKMIVKVLKMVHAAVAESTDCSMGFISQIFAKICVRSHGDQVYSILLPEIETLVKRSPLWCRICQKLFSSIDDPSLDAVIQPLLLRCRSYEIIYQLLGDFTKEKRNHLKYLMTHKYLFYRQYSKDIVPYCIMGYVMKCSNDNSNILVETLKKLLDAWGNINSIKHTSYEQHLYITKCILIGIGFLQQNYKGRKFPEKLASALSSKLLAAMSPHLESPIEKFRNLGMIVAEEITSICRINDSEPLKFEFRRDDEALYLASIARDPSLIERSENMHPLPEMESVDTEAAGISSEPSSSISEKTSKVHSEESDLDSDDDLEPYPMDEENEGSAVNGVRPPVYISECISGLLSKDDPLRLEACLAVAEKLVRREPPELPELAVEFVKILLYLQDNYDTRNFVSLRLGAMAAVTVKCPKRVIAYLTKEFYEENYNLGQRMDMLEVISASALELSQPIEANPKSLQKHLPLPNIPGMTSKEKPEWQVVVEERIKSKTRIISHGRRNPPPTVVANKFSAVAGEFFFPLLKNFDSNCRTFDLLGQDFMVLGKLVHTLGTIIHASSGLSITRMMTSAMFDFVWSLRYHKEPFVRQALLYATCMCLLACPSNILLTDLNSELMENHEWVTDVVNSDPNRECREMAAHALLLIDKVVKMQFHQDQ